MEAVPRLHMLWFALKSSPEGTTFTNLKKYIAEFYQEDPESYSKEVFALETLRNQAIRTTKDGSAVMKRYYCQLHSLQNRFPQLSERGIFTFTWKDLYQNNVSEVTDMRFELAAVLFNIAASHTQSGASVTRGDIDGMKMACTHFQCAAWAFGELRERYANINSGNDFMTTELLLFMQQVCYAQAQECILEKSLIDNRKPNIVAKVTAQIVVYYGAALAALLTGGDDGPVAQVVNANVYKLWKKYIRFKISYLHCILYLYQGQHAEEQRKMGERVTLYQAAWDKLEEARKESKGLPDQAEINESLNFTADVVEAKRKNAKNENEFIYHESVPELSTIGAVQGANLVSGLPFSVTDPEVAGNDIFARLVPMKAHEASSMYSEEKAKLLRKYGNAIEEKDTELASYMSSLTLEHLNINEEKANKLPQGIVDRCAALNANKTAISDLIAAMSQLAEITADVETNLSDIQHILQLNELEEKDFQAESGVPYTPNPHITELTREYQKYNEAHIRAGESNNTLHKAMSLHVNNLKILARPLQEIQQMMPKLSAELNTAEIFKDVKLIVNKVNEMKAQRAQFHADLRIAINDDDITAKVIAHGTNEGLQALFERELAKHERLIQLIEQNLLAQQNILQALTESYAKAAPVIKTLADVKQKRENFFSSLAASYDVYEDLLAKSAKGLEFYKKLSGNVQKLLTRFKAARDVQAEERQQRLKNLLPAQPNAKLSKSPTLAVMSPATTTVSTPKLRDYLKAKNTNAASIVAACVTACLNDNIAAAGYVPPIRPVPLGSENPTQAVCSSNNYYNNSNSSVAPNEPPPPYSLQQQYYDPNSVGFTNPMYQLQQHIAPPAYKLQASPNSQFTNLDASLSNLSLQGNYANQQLQPQPSMAYRQQATTPSNPHVAGYNYGAQFAAQSKVATTTNNVAAPFNVYDYQQNASLSMTKQPQQQQQPLNYQTILSVSSATSPLPTLQQLYVATANHQLNSEQQVPLSLQAPYVTNPIQQQQLLLQQQTQQQAFQEQSLQQSQQQAQQYSLQSQQPSQLAAQQQQQLPLQTKQMPLQQTPQSSAQQQQQQSPQQLQPQQIQQQQKLSLQVQQSQQLTLLQTQQLAIQQPTATIPTSSTPSIQPPIINSEISASTKLSSTISPYASGSSSHPGYRYNPHTGTYDYFSGYQQDVNATAKVYGHFTFTPSNVVGTTDSEKANKINLSTGFDSPIISHTKTAAAAATINGSTEISTSGTETAIANYYAAPYGYRSTSGTTTVQAPPQQMQQLRPQSTFNLTQQQKSIYIQSGTCSIADTQTTKSSAEYASSVQQSPVNLAAVTQPANDIVPVTAPTVAAKTTTQKTGKPVNIDLLSDIDFSSSDTNVPPPILPQTVVLQPQILKTSTPPASQVSVSNELVRAKLNESGQKAIETTTTATSPTPILQPVTQTSTQQLQLSSPLPSPATRKSSIDNLSNCSDLSSLDNFDWDSVSVIHSINEKHSIAGNSSSMFQMQPFDPFTDDKALKYFHKEVERYEKIIENLNVKMLNGHTQLTAKWKELQDLLTKDTTKRTTSIAKLFPEKNRSLDCLPYDHARVKLDKDTDDYINAAHVKNLGAGCPNFIIAQTPQQNTLNDFWSMIWSQKARTVLCLHTSSEMIHPFWPQTIDQESHYDDFTVNCVQIEQMTHSIAYQIKLSMHGADPIMDLSILQIKQWSKSILPTQVIGIAQNALQVHQKRCLTANTPTSPLIMNCLTGSERSELLAVAICAILATQNKRPILINVVDVWSRICVQRQNSLRDTTFLEQSMQIVLNHAHDVLNKRGIMTSYQMKIAPQVASKEQQELKDPLNDLDPLWKLKQ